jgi:hypothetical protein
MKPPEKKWGHVSTSSFAVVIRSAFARGYGVTGEMLNRYSGGGANAFRLFWRLLLKRAPVKSKVRCPLEDGHCNRYNLSR